MDRTNSIKLDITSASPEGTRALGERLGRALLEQSQPVWVVALRGDLGAGKTTFTQGLARALGIDARITSPTFTLVNEYEGEDEAIRLLHLDTYRLADATGEALGLGLEEMLDFAGEDVFDSAPTVIVVEWAERIAKLLPRDRLAVDFAYGAGEQSRRVVIEATGSMSEAVVQNL